MKTHDSGPDPNQQTLERPEQDEWKFGSTDRNIMFRWQITKWCNYKCSYCPQPHGRHQKLFYLDPKKPSTWLKSFSRRNSAHSFDYYPAEKWVERFKEIASRRLVVLVITGGEPFLDTHNFPRLLAGLTAIKNVHNIRIDTNISWNPKIYSNAGTDFKKIYLNASFHPENTNLHKFLGRLKVLQKYEIQIAMVNFVMAPSQMHQYPTIRNKISELGIKVNPAVFLSINHRRSETELSLYRKYLHPFDIGYKTGGTTPFGKLCRYPSIGYQLRPNGDIHVGCLGYSEHFFKGALPRGPEGPVPCPHKLCYCLDMYPFLLESPRGLKLNVLKDYVDNAIL